MNPLFPREYFIPDGEPHVMPDGRLYVYGSADLSEDPGYCSDHYYVFSTNDMENWTNHGISFRAGTDPEAHLQQKVTLGGPDCIEKDGKYYLYYCTSRTGEGVAVSDTPYGPFQNPSPILHADGDAIDPAVFVDDDGQAYYYWGQFTLRAARLKPDMRELDMSTYHPSIATEWEHGFHEGASMRKRGGLYYLIYTDITRGRATCLSYAIGRTPFGPFERKGVIIDNIGSDPSVWNNHGSIEELKGQWYIFYHRSSMNSRACRRMCAEPIFFREDGTIVEAQMTSQGSSSPIDASLKVDASLACRMKLPWHEGQECCVHIRPRKGHGEILTMTREGDWAEYRYLDFGEGKHRFTIYASCPKECRVELRIENNQVIAGCEITNTGSWDTWQEFTCELTENVSGVHPLWLHFTGTNGQCRLADVDWFSFT